MYYMPYIKLFMNVLHIKKLTTWFILIIKKFKVYFEVFEVFLTLLPILFITLTEHKKINEMNLGVSNNTKIHILFFFYFY